MGKKKIYIYINIIIMLLMATYIILNRDIIFILEFKYLILAAIPFIFIHFFRIIRQYIILMKNKIHIKNLTKLYLSSSLLNTIFPYKLGEIYKIYLYGNDINDYKKSIISVVIDKFFDALFLLILFIIIGIKRGQALSYITILLLFIVCIIFIAYLTFEKSYKFLNEFLIMYKNNKTTLKCLKILEKANDIYIEIKDMIKNRETLLFFLTILSWAAEIVFVYVINMIKYNNFNLSNFMEYVNNSFFGIQNELVNYYIMETVVLIVIYIFAIGIKNIFMGRKKENKI